MELAPILRLILLLIIITYGILYILVISLKLTMFPMAIARISILLVFLLIFSYL